MAVRLDLETLVASLGEDLAQWGRECAARGQLLDLEAEDGGARAVLDDPDCGQLDVWVGVVDGVLTGECDCADGGPDRLCGHAVAVALAALAAEFTFSSISARSGDADPEEREFAEIAAELAPEALIGLVARQAATDRYFAAVLLASAGRLPAPGPAEIAAARRVVAAAAGVPDRGRWDLHDLVEAGRAMLTELELLAVRPPTEELLIVVEEAISVWAMVSGHLDEAGPSYDTEPEAVGTALAELHLRLCQAYDPEPLELARRLAKLVGEAEGGTFLDVPAEYAEVLGEQALAEFEALLARR